MKAGPDTRVGIGYDVHPLAAGRPLVLGGVTVPHERGLAGHSDADVVAHAVVDALLGATALGTIGEHFPDTDPRWAGAASLGMLEHVAGLLRAAGWTVANVDAVVTAQAPRLAPHLDAMASNLARAMGVARDQVSVKATSPEGLGALGRGEGIDCRAVALVSA